MSNKSILGSSFDNFVSSQLDMRTQILSSNGGNFQGNINRSLQSIQYVLKTGFIRLTSGVNITDPNLAVFLGSESYLGDGLAKSFILQGGTLNSGSLRGGLTGPNASYTQGELGLRPMAGITSANVISRGRWGSLRDATINIKCSDRDQLSIVELLYCRPGYTILLEWGHSTFIDNNGKTITNIEFIDFFTGNTDKNKIYEQILKKREQYSGNYDAFVGPVMNFNIKENADGSYNVMVKAVTWGQIIESLKINASSNTVLKSTHIEDYFPKFEFSSDPSLGNTTSINTEELNNSRLETLIKTFYNTVSKTEFQNKRVTIIDAYQQYFDTHPTGHALNKDAVKINGNSLATFSNIGFYNDDLKSANSTIYMSLGSLLALISRNCLLYTTPTQEGKVNDKSIPVININFNAGENFCFSPENHISMDPNICLIKYTGNNFPELGLDEKVINSTVNKLLLQFKDPNSSLVGRTMNIMVNVNHILEKLQILKKKDGTVNLYQFLTDLMADINLALGKVNDFNVGIDDETNTLSIYDNQILANSPKKLTMVNTLGLKSSVRDIWIDTKINNNLSSLIAIGAQASGTGAGLDASILSEYNKGIKDRISPNRKSPDNNDNQSTEEYTQSLAKDERAKLIKTNIQNIYISNKLILKDIEQCDDFYSDIVNTLKSKNRKSIAIIPFTYNMKMDGISGIRYGQLFSVETTRLPKNYINMNNKALPAIAFLVTNVDHNIEDNTWTTTISGQMAPIREGLSIK